MNDLILILSRCLNQTKKVHENGVYYRFHFKGYYLGNRIHEILLRPSENVSFEKGEDYLLWVKYQGIVSGILKVDLIRSKKI